MSGSFEADVRAAIETYIAPLVACDGGTIELISTSDAEDTVVVALDGACIGCPARTITRDSVLVPLLTAELGRPIAVELA
jgi:Fe-S cluster biogenesis protein NfuA